MSEGLVEVVKKQQNKDHQDVLKLIELEEAAKSASKGKWGVKGGHEKRELLQEVDEPTKFVGKSFNGIVEHVRDGSTLRIALEVDHKKKYQMITLMLSGIRSPLTTEPYGEEAKFFTESRLLQRDVNVRVEQVSGGSNSSSFIGSVSFGNNNIAEHLVKEGFAKCVDWTLTLAKDPVKLRKFEKEAKSKKLRIWRDYKDASQGSGSNQSFDGKVIEIINGDALMVKDIDKNVVKKIFISSVRPPRPEAQGKEERGKSFRPLYDVPFLFEAREFLRKRLIGKKVKIVVDYIQPKTEQFPEKICCTIFDNQTNIGEALVSRGLASVIRYRPDDEARSHCYDALLEAELKAQKSGKGIFGNSKDAGIIRIVDLSSDLSKAKQFLPFLLRTSTARKDAVIEFVYSPSRVKVYIPKENCLLNLVLAGVSTPKSNEPLGSEGANFVKNLIHQREVQLQIEAMDKVGNYIGWVYFEDGKKNLALELIKSGFASVRDFKYQELVNAESEAKQKKIGIWENYKEEEHENHGENGGEDEAGVNGDNKDDLDLAKRKKVIITNTSPDMSTFHAQFVDDGPQLEETLTDLREELELHPPLPGAYQPKKGDVVAAKFSLDNQWYRAKIEKIVNHNEVQVVYIDYGNRETVSNRNVAPLPSTQFSSLAPAAKEYTLAFVRLPTTDQELIEDARNAFVDDTTDKVLLIKNEYKDPSSGLDAVTLVEEQSKQDVIMNLVSEGYFLADKSRRERRLQKSLNEYKNAQETAKKKRVRNNQIAITLNNCLIFFPVESLALR